MKTEMTLAEFDELLAVHGSERTRWPLELRAAAGRLLAHDPAARRLIDEAEALDGLLDRAAVPARNTDVLAARIVAAAQRSPRIATSAPAMTADVKAAAPAPRRRRNPLDIESIGVGALLTAASLMLGILIGLSGLPQSVLRPVQQLTGLPIASAQSSHTAAIDTLDEDLL